MPLPEHLPGHERRWAELGIAKEHFVEWNGKPVKSVKTALRRPVLKAKLEGNVTPHTLRHTAATWLMQNGVPVWEAAGFLGMSPRPGREDLWRITTRIIWKVAAAGFRRPKKPRIGGDNGGDEKRVRQLTH